MAKSKSVADWWDFSFNGEVGRYSKEEVKLISHFPQYCISTDGKIWSRWSRNGLSVVDFWTEKLPDVNRKGHLRVELYGSNSIKVRRMVHHIVLETFRGDCPEGMECCHSDGNPANNFLLNLRWDTAESNWADRRRHGKACEGSNNKGSKINEQIAAEIKQARRVGVTLRELKEKIGISMAMISKIDRGEAWKHVD